VLSRNLSADGDRVFFESTDALVAADINGEEGCPIVGGQHQQYPACKDVYEWEANGRGSCHSDVQGGGCLYLISTGRSKEPSLFGDASESGKDVFVFTASRLVGQDQDDLLDAYDAREGGGLASQSAPEVGPCDGESCKGQPAPVPANQSPGSAGFAGPGDPIPVRHHKKKHHKKKHHKKHRKTKATGRASR
jgi:hypothetical protein